MKLKRFLSCVLSLLLVLPSVFFTPFAYAEEDTEEAKDPSEYEYPVPDGLPVVDVTSWEFRLANSCNSISCYKCPLVSGIETQGVDRRIYEAAVQMIYDCRDAGYPIYIAAGYRDFEYWEIGWWESVVKLQYNYSAYDAAQEILPPGCNEHQLGLGIDLTSNAGYASNYEFARCEDDYYSESFIWLNEHCAEYGFVQRYPEGKEAYYGVACCPWHYRYVGVEAATYMKENNLCLEEFLMLYGYPVTLPGQN